MPESPKKYLVLGGVVIILGVIIFFFIHPRVLVVTYHSATAVVKSVTGSTPPSTAIPPLDTAAYNAKLIALANNPAPRPAASSTKNKASSTTSTTVVAPKPTLWPVKTAYPNPGALLPFNRIVAYYGNFYSTGMGVLGEYPANVMIPKLLAEVKNWEAADPTTPVIPAIDYIAVTAQGSAGKDGKYRLEMPDSQIDHAIDLANQVNGIVILDVQVGLSSLQAEIPTLKKYLSMPKVMLAIDPEFDMKDGGTPGNEIGTVDASDVNWTANYLAQLVQANNLPPKILVVHRFTEDMVTNAARIVPLPEVQIVMDMDGWGSQAKKINTYQRVIEDYPVQFTGFKLFYKADLKAPSTGMLTPAQVLQLTPRPSFIQYQ